MAAAQYSSEDHYGRVGIVCAPRVEVVDSSEAKSPRPAAALSGSSHVWRSYNEILPSKLAVTKTPGERGLHCAAKFQWLLRGSSATTSNSTVSHTIVLRSQVQSTMAHSRGNILARQDAGYQLSVVAFVSTVDEFTNRLQSTRLALSGNAGRTLSSLDDLCQN